MHSENGTVNKPQLPQQIHHHQRMPCSRAKSTVHCIKYLDNKTVIKVKESFACIMKHTGIRRGKNSLKFSGGSSASQ